MAYDEEKRTEYAKLETSHKRVGLTNLGEQIIYSTFAGFRFFFSNRIFW